MAENQEVPAGMKRALEILTSVLQAANGDYLEKSMLIVPDVEADSDETQKRDALTKQNPHVRDKRHRPEGTQIQYLCVRRGEEHAFETGHGNTCSYWKGRP